MIFAPARSPEWNSRGVNSKDYETQSPNRVWFEVTSSEGTASLTHFQVRTEMQTIPFAFRLATLRWITLTTLLVSSISQDATIATEKMAIARISVDAGLPLPTEVGQSAANHSPLIDWSAIGFFPGSNYDWDASTECNYQSESKEFYGKFKHIRERLDYQYHVHYTAERQRLQDVIIDFILHSKAKDRINSGQCRSAPEPWIIFTAGVMGAGKSYTVRELDAKGLFPLESFVVVDPDEIRRLLPEFNVYLEKHQEYAGNLTRKEAGMMAEILTEAALEDAQNVLKDGSLRDAHWYTNYFSQLRRSVPGIRLGIIHVTAPLNVIFQRVDKRAKETGRVVPRDVLTKNAEQVPKSVAILRDYVDFFLEIDNSGGGGNDGVKIVKQSKPFDLVRRSFAQHCEVRRETVDLMTT